MINFIATVDPAFVPVETLPILYYRGYIHKKVQNEERLRRNENILADYNEGKSVIYLEQKYSLSRQGIANAVTSMGGTLRPKGKPPSEIAVKLKAKGKSYWEKVYEQHNYNKQEIVDKYGVSHGVIRSLFTSFGVKIPKGKKRFRSREEDVYFFLKHVKDVDSGCSEWFASLNPAGYGLFWDKNNGKMVLAHRFSYELFVGEIPKGLLVRHDCDNPKCVNPKHLRLGTYADNAKDRKKRGRTVRGKPSPIKGKSIKRGFPVYERFCNHIEVQDSGCWFWIGHVTPTGYGNFWVNKDRKIQLAHRWIYEYTYNVKLSRKQIVRHKCDVRVCVNPEHLQLGSRADNSRDVDERNRRLKGDAHPQSILTVTKIKKYLSSCVKENTTACIPEEEISLFKGVLNGVSWRHLFEDNEVVRKQRDEVRKIVENEYLPLKNILLDLRIESITITEVAERNNSCNEVVSDILHGNYSFTFSFWSPSMMERSENRDLWLETVEIWKKSRVDFQDLRDKGEVYWKDMFSKFSVRELADKYGTSYSAMLNMLKSFGIEIRLFTDKDIALIGEMRVSGNSYVEIAKYFGCSITTIRNYLKREGFLIGKL